MRYVLGLLLLLIVVRVLDPTPVERIRLIGFDSYINSLDIVHNEDIVLGSITEQSLEIYGQYPWARQQYAQVISDLRNANAGAIVFTILFPEPDRFGGDEVFASWINDNGIILAQTGSHTGRSTAAPFVGTPVLGDGNPYMFASSYKGMVTNIPQLESVAQGAGVLNSSPEIDNVTRRIPLVIQSNSQLYPTLALEVLRGLADKKSYTLKVEENGIENIRIPPYEPIITDSSGSVWITWNNRFKEISIGSKDYPDLKGKAVLIGVTAAGVQPLVSTPAGQQYPHQIHGSVLANLMTGESLPQRPIWSSALEVILIASVAVLVALAVYKLPMVWSLIVFVFVSGCSFYGPWHLWNSYGLLIDYTYLMITSVFIFAQSSFHNFYIQFKLRQLIKKQFGTYLSPDMVMMLQKDPTLLKLGGEKKEMTFLFMDIVGFTPISEHYKNNDDPEGLVLLVNEFLDAMTTIILNNGGTIDKYMGDCIMAFWNAPLPCSNHAEMAVKSAIEIEIKTNELRKIYKARGLPDINVGTGVNTGDCIVGNMGSESRFDYSVIGDAVNLAARLEATAARHEYLEHKTIISSMTKEQLPHGFLCTEIGTIKVKGKEDLIQIYSPSTGVS